MRKSYHEFLKRKFCTWLALKAYFQAKTGPDAIRKNEPVTTAAKAFKGCHYEGLQKSARKNCFQFSTQSNENFFTSKILYNKARKIGR
jgi:hypothetical protein